MDDVTLPPEIQAALAELTQGGGEGDAPEERSRLEAVGQALASKRHAAVTARKNSGIEEVWTKCEESYIGIDEANRGEYLNAKWAKPISADGPISTNEHRPRPDEEVRSTAYPRLTARYVDAGTAKLCEILLPPDDKAFAIESTPDPDLVMAKDDRRQIAKSIDGQLVPLQRDATSEEQAQMAPPTPLGPPSGPPTGQPGMPATPPGVPLMVQDLAKEQLANAEDAAGKAEERIYDWMVEGKYTPETRKVVHDAARLGVGVLKAPFPLPQKAMAIVKGDDGSISIEMQTKIIPGAKRIDPWNFFPDPSCGEDIHFGDFVFERDYLSKRQIRMLKGQRGYVTSQIELVLQEGPGKIYLSDTRPHQPDLDERFECWYFYGTLEKDDLLAINPDAQAGLKETQTEAYVIATMINDHVIRAVINPLHSGEFPYHAMPWQRRDGSWDGIGVAEQIAMPQRMATAAVRQLLNNAGMSGSLQVVMNRDAVVPADKKWSLTGGMKVWFVAPESAANGGDVTKAFETYQFPNHVQENIQILEMAFRLAEDACSIPLISQGQSGKTTPDTYGAAQLQDNNANQLLRSIGYRFDDYITEPVVRQYYEWLLLDPDVPSEEKGDFQINAHGSSAMVERHLQDQTLASLAGMVNDPKYKIDPMKFFEELMRSKRLSARKIQYTDEQQAKIDQQPPPKAPVVQAAEIRAQVDLQKEQMHTSREQAYVQVEEQKNAADHELRQKELEMKLQLAMLDYSNQRGMTLDQTKAKLADTAMRLSTQRQLAAIDNVIDLHKHHTPPPVIAAPSEPPGRAEAGKAFEQ